VRSWFSADQIHVRMLPSAEVQVDVAELASALDDRNATSDRLLVAAALYQGELLPGFYDDWVGVERIRAQSTFDLLMQRLLNRLNQECRWEEAIRWGQHWFAHGEEQEAACCSVMHAQSALGNSGGVRAIYRRCAQQLQSELGILPSAETVALYERLSQYRSAGVGEAPSAPAPGSMIRQTRPATINTEALLNEQHWRMRSLLGFDTLPGPAR
jgi:DNA-binding SARP family transcriptional activator